MHLLGSWARLVLLLVVGIHYVCARESSQIQKHTRKGTNRAIATDTGCPNGFSCSGGLVSPCALGTGSTQGVCLSCSPSQYSHPIQDTGYGTGHVCRTCPPGLHATTPISTACAVAQGFYRSDGRTVLDYTEFTYNEGTSWEATACEPGFACSGGQRHACDAQKREYTSTAGESTCHGPCPLSARVYTTERCDLCNSGNERTAIEATDQQCVRCESLGAQGGSYCQRHEEAGQIWYTREACSGMTSVDGLQCLGNGVRKNIKKLFLTYFLPVLLLTLGILLIYIITKVSKYRELKKAADASEPAREISPNPTPIHVPVLMEKKKHPQPKEEPKQPVPSCQCEETVEIVEEVCEPCSDCVNHSYVRSGSQQNQVCRIIEHQQECASGGDSFTDCTSSPPDQAGGFIRFSINCDKCKPGQLCQECLQRVLSQSRGSRPH